MNKILLVLFSIILLMLLTITGTLFYAFSISGNETLKLYIQKELEEKIGLPVVVRKFSLEAGKSRLIMRINKEADVEVVTNYDILAQSFKGIYRVRANNFHYKDLVLREADIQGHFRGVAEDVAIDGKGTALDANLAYSLRILDKKPQNIEANIIGLSLAEVLALSGETPLAKGKMDIDINMPDIGEEFANGYAKMILHDALFDVKLVKKMYDLQLPQKSAISAKIDAKLKGKQLHFVAKAKSNLFMLELKDAFVDLSDKNITATYMMDVKEMGILTQNQLAGPLKVSGKVEASGKKYHISGGTNSLGGPLVFDLDEIFKFHLDKLELNKIAILLKQPVYAKGLLSGSGDVDKDLKTGRYDVQIQKGVFGAKSIEKKFGYQIPSVNTFHFTSKGTIAQKVLEAKVSLKSSISDIKLTELVYDMEKKKLQSDYDVFLPNIGLIIPDNKAVKRGYMSFKGEMKFDKMLYFKGSAKGLGEKLDFVYDGKTATVDARNLFVEKLLSLSALPRYVKGKLSTSVHISNLKNLDGTFSFKSDKLLTQPHVMERLIKKKLALQIALESKGKLTSGVAYLNTKMKTSMGNIDFNNMVIHTKNNTFKSQYVLDVPDLAKTYVLTKKKLYGPMVLKGNISEGKILKVTGDTASLGGKVDYTLIEDTLKANIVKVPLENILGLLGHDKLVQGNAYGTVNYHLKKKMGVIDLDIKDFQIKSSGTTKTIKMFIGKDPARIIYTSAKVHANINGDVTSYTLMAKGSHSSIEVTQGKIDKEKDRHTAQFKFVYEKYVVTGAITGTVDHPQIMVDPSSIMQSKTGEKIQKKLDKALGGDMGKAVGGFLKGFKF